MSEASASRDTVPWWAISTALHALAFLLLYHFTPLRELVRPDPARAARPAPVSSERVRAVQEQMTARAEERLRQRLEALLRIEREMEKIEATRLELYQQMAHQEAGDALQVALAEMERAVAEQRAALEQQRRLRDSLVPAAAEMAAFLARHPEFDPARRTGERAQ